jgi:transposase
MKWDLGRSHRETASAQGVSLGVVTSVLKRATEAGLDWAAVQEMAEEALDAMLYPRGPSTPSARGPMPDFPALNRERLKAGVTLQLLHIEYREANPQGFGYTQFCEYYRRWRANRGLTMRQVHIAGDKLFVDYSGKKAHYTDPTTGVPVAVELFVAVFGASNFTFAEATHTQRVPDFIASHVRAFAYFGGVPAALVPDQLKSAVIGASRYEPDLQRTYEDLAEHYGTAVVPARPKKPRDKAKVEVGVQIVQRWILARLRNQTFFSLGELNAAIAGLIEDLNGRTMKRYRASRRELFDRTDRPALRPLPSTPYDFAVWSKCKVETSYHVMVDDHAYSVPHTWVGFGVEARATAALIEIIRSNGDVSTHARSFVPGGATTNPDHLPVAHRKHLEWTPERIAVWAGEVGPATAALTEAILRERPHPEQGYRSCLGVLRLHKRYGSARMERACARAMAAGARSARHVESILVHGLDRLEPLNTPPAPATPIAHENLRGRTYYN